MTIHFEKNQRSVRRHHLIARLQNSHTPDLDSLSTLSGPASVPPFPRIKQKNSPFVVDPSAGPEVSAIALYFCYVNWSRLRTF